MLRDTSFTVRLDSELLLFVKFTGWKKGSSIVAVTVIMLPATRLKVEY